MPAPGCGDRFFFAVLHETGCRAGEVLGLRHEDIAAAEQEITIVARENANGARAKSGGRTVPVGPELIRLYADYLHEEYGVACSDFVFINIWAEPKGHAWSYQAAYNLVLRLRARTGIAFDPHWYRHSAATRWLRDGVPVEVVSALLGHSSVAVTSSVYGHLTAQDARAALEKAGWFTGKEVPVVTGGWITQADRSRWQQRAAAELAVILAAHPDIPVLAWTITASGGALSGQILVPGAGRRGLFGQWHRALRLDEVTEPRSGTGTPVYLHARGVRGGVTVSVTARCLRQRRRRPVSRPDVSGAEPAGQHHHRAAAGLLEKLMGAVRPEFRASEIVFDPADPVFGGAICRVASAPERHGAARDYAPLTTTGGPLQGRPDLDAFVAATSPRWHRQEPLACCRAPGCGRGVRRQGMCTHHSAAWERSGHPDTGEWLAGVPAAVTPEGQQYCLVGFCGLWAERDIWFCQGHGATWKVNGRPEPGGFAARYLDANPVPVYERIFVDSLPPQLKLKTSTRSSGGATAGGKAPPSS